MSNERDRVKTIEVLRTPFANHGYVRNWSISETETSGPRIYFEYEAEQGWESFTFEFVCARARRFFAESLVRTWMQGEGNNGGVVYEVVDSTWIQELEKQVQDRWKGRFSLRHFIVYFESGLYEFAAEGVLTSSLDTPL